MSENNNTAPTDILFADEPSDTAETITDAGVGQAGPRTRWAGIIWGTVFLALALAGLWFASDDTRLDDAAGWARDLGVGEAIGIGLLALGALIVIVGLVGLLRRAQLALARRR